MPAKSSGPSVGDYRFHKEFGVGVVRQVNANDVVVAFERNPEFRTTVPLLKASTKPVDPNGFRALFYQDRAGAHTLIDENPVQVLTLVLRDFNGRAKTEEIREYLAPYFQSRDWAKWWKSTQPLLKRAESIDSSRAEQREYRLRSDALSEAEEAYQKFERVRSKLEPTDIYPYAITVWNAYKDGASLLTDHRAALKAYFERCRDDLALAPAFRLDAFLRLDEIGWLDDQDRISAIRPLLASGITLYDIDEFSENRVLELLLENSDDELARETLLTGLCSNPKTIDQVASWLMRLGDPVWLERGVATMLSKYLPPELADSRYDWLTHRFREGVRFLEALPSDADWNELADRFSAMLRGLSEAPSTGVDGKLNHDAFAAFSSALYRRVHPIAPELGQAVVNAFRLKEYRASFVRGLVLALEDVEIEPEFRDAVVYALLSAREIAQDSILALLLDSSTGSPPKRAAELLAFYQSHARANPALLGPIAARIVGLAQRATTVELVEMLPVLESLSDLGEAQPWQAQINAFRERAYLHALDLDSAGAQHSFGRLDSALLAAVQEFVREQLQDANSQIAQLQNAGQEQAAQLDSLAAKLVERESRVAELSSDYSRQINDLQDQERRRILLTVVTALAEFERFAAKQPKLAPEAVALLRRFESVLSGLGVSPMEPVGTEITFDPATCQLADITPMTTPERVRVVERGYTIKNRRGETQVLKRSVVQAQNEP